MAREGAAGSIAGKWLSMELWGGKILSLHSHWKKATVGDEEAVKLGFGAVFRAEKMQSG